MDKRCRLVRGEVRECGKSISGTLGGSVVWREEDHQAIYLNKAPHQGHGTPGGLITGMRSQTAASLEWVAKTLGKIVLRDCTQGIANPATARLTQCPVENPCFGTVLQLCDPAHCNVQRVPKRYWELTLSSLIPL